MFESFFGKSNQNKAREQANAERERLEREVNDELSKIDLTKETLLKLAPEQVRELMLKIGSIKEKLPPPDFEHEMETAKNTPKFPDELRKLETPEETLGYLGLLKGRERGFLDRFIEDTHLDCIVARKWKEYDMSHWREVMKEAFDRGTPLLGSEQNLSIDYYKKKGINIENPTEEDAKKYFENLPYDGGPVTGELGRRRLNDFKDIGFDRELAIQELLWNLMQVPSEGIAGFRSLRGEELEAKVNELEKKLG